mmetsp:Transcript_86202/g.180336  ORF Transcript_86202/g.180336 Transcript_86202/m.180336 type:complete len:99 (-) Transcript_86202:518-814(-)
MDIQAAKAASMPCGACAGGDEDGGEDAAGAAGFPPLSAGGDLPPPGVAPGGLAGAEKSIVGLAIRGAAAVAAVVEEEVAAGAPAPNLGGTILPMYGDG